MMIIAHEREAVSKIFAKVKLAWENFDPVIKQHLGIKANTDNANELKFNTNSSIGVALSSRSDTVNRLHISEFGKICKKYPLKAEEIITGAIPSVPDDGRIDIESTAEGEFGSFYDMFWAGWDYKPKAMQEFVSFFFPWFINPEYELEGDFDLPLNILAYQAKHNLTVPKANWYYITQKTLKDKMPQEHPSTPEEAFISSGNKLFNQDAVARQKVFCIEPIETSNDWKFFEAFNPKHRYGMGCDVAEGVGGDSSTCVIWDFAYLKPRVVATYKNNKISPDNFAYQIRFGAERYGACTVGVERNNHGHACLVKLKEIYDNDKIYKEVRQDKETDKDTEVLGWHTNLATKPKMLYDLSTAISDDEVVILDKMIVNECRTYDQSDLAVIRRKEDDTQTPHWDLLMAACIGYQMKTNLAVSEIKTVKNHTYVDLSSAL